jgi:hypothetical protein
MGSGGIIPRFLDLGISRRSVVSFPLRPVYPQGKAPCTCWAAGWMDPQSWSEQRRKESLAPSGLIRIVHVFRMSRQAEREPKTEHITSATEFRLSEWVMVYNVPPLEYLHRVKAAAICVYVINLPRTMSPALKLKNCVFCPHRVFISFI